MSSTVLGLLGLLLLAAGAQESPRAEEDTDWAQVWRSLSEIEGSAREVPGVEERAASLLELARVTRDRTRGLLLECRLERWRERPTDSLLEELADASVAHLGPEETWAVVEVLPPGPARVAAVHHGLESETPLAREALRLAWRAAIDEARALRLRAGALPIQRRLHESNRADWSALDLAVTLTRLGERAELDLVLEEAITAAAGAGRATGALWSQWGVSTLGFGDTARARDYLGRALANGSDDASLVLGLLDLEAGRLAAARNAFRPSILSDRPSAWAQRGWGLSLLPEARVQPATIR